MNKLAKCHKALPLAILLALLVCGHSQTSLAQSSSGLSASASGSVGSSNGGFSGQVGADANLSGNGGGSSGSSGSAQAQISANMGGGGPSGGAGPSGSGNILSGSESSSGASGSASSSASLGTLASASSAQSYAQSTPKPEGLFSKMKDMVKTSVDSLTSNDKREQEVSQSSNAKLTASASIGSSESGGQKSGGLMEKLGDAAKKGKEMVKETAKEVKDDVKSILKPDERGSGGDGASASASGSVKLGSASADAHIQLSGGNGSGGSGKEGPMAKLVSKGQEIVHKFENKASEMTKPMSSSSSSSSSSSGSSASGSSSASASASASAKVQIGSSKGSDKSLAVEVMDKMHEMSRAPVEHALRPIDKALGYKEDPLIRAMDKTEDMLRKPLSTLAKPVESILTGAFHTSEEARIEQERLMSEQERREVRLREEKARKDGRSVLGQITDRTVELAEKPFEIILKPIDRALGLSRQGEKSLLIQLIDQIYGLSKKPLDAIAKPFENILRKMADGEQAYQVSVRFVGSDTDPKLFTRLADGALNIADRVVTRPIEFAMRPLGYDQNRKKNPIVDAAHSLKNATRIGLELFTKPIDRIIKEIAAIGDIKDEAEREAEIQRKRMEASRFVATLDKLHEVIQAPFEIVLKPVGKVLGYNKGGRKDPLLRAWDVAHEVVMTPIQVIGKPLEDAILGEPKRSKFNVKGELKIGQSKVTAKASVGGAQGGARATASAARGAMGERRKNFFVESIKKIEKFATKPIDVITAPIRRLILGEDGKINGGRGLQAKAKLGPLQASAKIQTGSGDGKDKIVKTIEKINNVVLRPLEVMTQPISDMVTTNDGKQKSKIDVKIQGSGQMRGQESGGKISASSSVSGSGSGSGPGHAHASGHVATPGGSASSSASISG